jgi:hypothetical protein
LDDILIYSKSEAEHLEHIRKVLDILREKQLYAKSSKCDFWRREVQFLGYRVKEDQVHTDPKKVEAVKNWPIPQTVRDVRSFLGLAGFYRKFVKGFGSIAKPLTDILKSTEFETKFNTRFTKTAPVTLGEKEITAFEALKQALISAPCLVIWDPTKTTEVWCDASFDNSTIGAVLMQDHGNGGLQPVAYLSKVLNSAQSHYPTWEQELLALYLSLEEWRHYLLGVHFTARTDHNGLKFLRTQKHLKERQWHWMAFFSEYQFDLLYRPGKQMQVPDALSRKPRTTQDIQELLRIHDDEEGEPLMEVKIPTKTGRYRRILFALYSKARAQQKGVKHPDAEEIPSVFEYEKDPDYGPVYQKLTDPQSTPDPSLSLYNIRDGNVIWIDRHSNPRICVPQKYRTAILREYHDQPLGGHFGVDKTYFNLRQRYIWPNMDHFVHTYVTSCDACQKNKASHKAKIGTPQLSDPPEKPWEALSVDLCGPFPKTKNGNDYVIGFICNLTREAILLPCQKTLTAKGAVELFINHVLRRADLPKKINSDRGPQFIANFWKTLWKTLKTKVAYSAPYHPQSNPFIERQNKTFVETLRSFVNARQDDWEDYLPMYEFAYNNTVNPSLGDTPFFLSHGRQATMPVALAQPTRSPAVDDFILHLHNRIAAARDHLKQSQAKAADERKKKMRTVEFQVGDLVLLNTEHYNLQLPSLKLSPRWIGPLKIKQIRGPNTILIEVPPRLRHIEPIQNVEHVKPYVSRPPEIGPSNIPPIPDLIDGDEEFEVEEILSHRTNHKRTEYLVRFVGYGPEDDLWLPEKNLQNAQTILQEYHDRQNNRSSDRRPVSRQQAPRQLTRLGHLWFARGLANS